MPNENEMEKRESDRKVSRQNFKTLMYNLILRMYNIKLHLILSWNYNTNRNNI